MSTRLILAPLFGALLVWANAPMPVAYAQSDSEQERARQLGEEGAKAYKRGDYDVALDAFDASYALDPSPGMAYNLARVHEARRDYVLAERYYREFIDAPDADVDARSDALKRLKLVQELAAVSRPEPDPAPLVSPPSEPAAAAAAPEALAAAPDAAPPNPASSRPAATPVESEQESGPSGATWVILGLAGAAIANGAVFGVLANDEAEALSAICQEGVCPESARGNDERLRQRALIADASYVGGAALALVGAITWVATSGGDEERASRLVPSLRPGAASVVWSRRF